MDKNDQAQRLNSIRDREKKAHDSVTTFKANLEHIRGELRKASDQAKNLYGTDDVGELRNRYAKDKQENDNALNAFDDSVSLREQLIDTIQTNVSNLGQS